MDKICMQCFFNTGVLENDKTGLNAVCTWPFKVRLVTWWSQQECRIPVVNCFFAYQINARTLHRLRSAHPETDLFGLFFSAGIIFFSHNNLARTVFFNQFQPRFSKPNGAMRTLYWMWIRRFCLHIGIGSDANA